jgi:Flp pilus assembly protein TadB
MIARDKRSSLSLVIVSDEEKSFITSTPGTTTLSHRRTAMTGFDYFLFHFICYFVITIIIVVVVVVLLLLLLLLFCFVLLLVLFSRKGVGAKALI